MMKTLNLTWDENKPLQVTHVTESGLYADDFGNILMRDEDGNLW